jgi:hypothetical protein
MGRFPAVAGNGLVLAQAAEMKAYHNEQKFEAAIFATQSYEMDTTALCLASIDVCSCIMGSRCLTLLTTNNH